MVVVRPLLSRNRKLQFGHLANLGIFTVCAACLVVVFFQVRLGASSGSISLEGVIAQLPNGWVEALDSGNKTYYYNQKLGLSSWDPPKDFYANPEKKSSSVVKKSQKNEEKKVREASNTASVTVPVHENIKIDKSNPDRSQITKHKLNSDAYTKSTKVGDQGEPYIADRRDGKSQKSDNVIQSRLISASKPTSNVPDLQISSVNVRAAKNKLENKDSADFGTNLPTPTTGDSSMQTYLNNGDDDGLSIDSDDLDSEGGPSTQNYEATATAMSPQATNLQLQDTTDSSLDRSSDDWSQDDWGGDPTAGSAAPDRHPALSSRPAVSRPVSTLADRPRTEDPGADISHPPDWPTELPGADGDGPSWIVGMHREPLWSDSAQGCSPFEYCDKGVADRGHRFQRTANPYQDKRRTFDPYAQATERGRTAYPWDPTKDPQASPPPSPSTFNPSYLLPPPALLPRVLSLSHKLTTTLLSLRSH